MLRTLELSNFAIVDELALELSPGLNVLTGETGAGKSILIDALALLIGGRADTSLIRSGSESALIQGQFEGLGLDSAARRLVATGRSSARVNGEIVSIGELAERGGALVAIHGQHASQTLLEAAEQRALLDRTLPDKVSRDLQTYRESFAKYQAILKEFDSLSAAARDRARRLDIIQFQLGEIDSAKLSTEEEVRLNDRIGGLRHAERILQHAGRALAQLSEDDSNALGLLSGAVQSLEAAGRYSQTLNSLAGELREELNSLQATASELEHVLSDFELDPGELEHMESRLAAIDKLKLKYGDTVAAVLSYRDALAEEHERLSNAEASLGALEQRKAQLEHELGQQAGALSQARLKSAKTLSKRVTKEIRQLGMPNATFLVNVNQRPEFNAHGRDKVSFLFTANLGEAPAPLSEVASGGELSRLMLGLNVVTGSDLPVLAFDEVDAGIGGKTARAVGALLKRLAKDHQVLVVTHLPQVAAFADAQFYVEKQEKAGRTVTRVERLEPGHREAELARMLSGAVTDAALTHARELLQEARASVASH